MSQSEELLEMLSDEQPHTAISIYSKLGIWRVAARVHGLKQRGYDIKSWSDPVVRSKHWYQLIVPERKR